MENKIKWLREPHVSLRFVIAVALMWGSLLIAFSGSQLYENLETRVGLPLYFNFRDFLGLSPKLNSRIKVFTVDDKAVAHLKRTFLTDKQWVEVLTALDNKGPEAIVIDGLFSLPNSGNLEFDAIDFRETMRPLTDLGAKTVVGAYVAPARIPYRQPISADSHGYDLMKHIRVPSDADGSESQIAEGLSIPVAVGEYIYGPDPAYREYFKNYGHILNSGDSRMSPFLRLGPTTAVPHLMLMSVKSDEVTFYGGNLYIKNQKVPTSKDGRILINFSNPLSYLREIKSIRSLLIPEQRDRLLGQVERGDIVYIIPNLYTGNTDFRQSPFGLLPGGFSHLAILNSMLNGEWISSVQNTTYLLLGCSFVASFAAIKVGWLGFTLLSGLFAVFWLLAALSLFAYWDLLLPLTAPILAFYGPLFALFAQKRRVADKKAQYIRFAFEGSVESSKLETIAKHPSCINFEARERVVTIMFIDIVGFSLLAEHQQPRVAFDTLKSVLNRITSTIHQFGGIVNKNLGDGLLCFFGYSLDTDESSYDHAEKALACAIQIQRENVPKLLDCIERNEDVYPLRIGINTASVFLGNIGSGDKLDFTIVGNGVNFAKRLEGACETNSVLIGSTTKDLLSPVAISAEAFEKKLIKIKHHDEMIESWEYDPFFDQRELVDNVNEALRSIRVMNSAELPVVAKLDQKVTVNTKYGTAKVKSFLPGGFTLELNKGLEAKQHLDLYLQSEDDSLSEMIATKNFGKISVVVTWVVKSSNGYLHSVQLKGLSLSEIKSVIALLEDHGRGNSENISSESDKSFSVSVS